LLFEITEFAQEASGRSLMDMSLGVVVAPVLVLLAFGALVYALDSTVTKAAPIGLGTLHVATVVLYGSYPLAIYILLGGYYTPLSDVRLFTMQPAPDVMARFGWYYVSYVVAFAISYYLAGGGKRPCFNSVRPTAPSMIWAVVLVLVSLRVMLTVVDAVFATPSDDYLAQYTRYQALPLIVRQALTHAGGIQIVVSIVAAVLLASSWSRYRAVAMCWLAAELAMLAFGLGARTQFFVVCLALALSIHFLHRPFRAFAVLAGGGALVGMFLAIGLVRGLAQGGAAGAAVELLAASSEFEAILANAIDIENLVVSGQVSTSEIAAAVYFGDLLVIPQQLLPFEKLDLPQWYATTFYSEYAEAGGAFAFGAIAQSMAGSGPLDLIWRAAIVGVIYAWLERWVFRATRSIWQFAFFVWVACFSYQAFRSTTFQLVPMFVYQFLPALVAVAVLAKLLLAAGRGSNRQVITSP
jgi:hypothetical protein